MFYQKNLYGWEQMLRIASGLGLAAYVLYDWPGNLLMYLIAASSVAFAVTGVVGWCPMCAMAGRRLDRTKRAH
jgi:hypothetical protein